jgi:uncharacterized membrane protein
MTIAEGRDHVRGSLGLDDLEATDLSDESDRDELRRRYYNLLQELRVLLPGVQVLVAFLLTVPFAPRFTELDETSKSLYLTSLVAGVLAIVGFVTPTAFHRFGDRRSRSDRLVWAIRTTRLGVLFMALALESAVFVVCRLVFDATAAFVVTSVLGVLMVAAWLVLPLTVGRRPGSGKI